MEFIVAALCIAGVAYVLISHVVLLCIKRFTGGLRKGPGDGLMAREARDYIFGKPPTRDERRAMRSNRGERR